MRAGANVGGRLQPASSHSPWATSARRQGRSMGGRASRKACLPHAQMVQPNKTGIARTRNKRHSGSPAEQDTAACAAARTRVGLAWVAARQPHQRQHSVLSRHCTPSGAGGTGIPAGQRGKGRGSHAREHGSRHDSAMSTPRREARLSVHRAGCRALAPPAHPSQPTRAIVDGGGVVQRLQGRAAHMRRARHQPLQGWKSRKGEGALAGMRSTPLLWHLTTCRQCTEACAIAAKCTKHCTIKSPPPAARL